ncbi:MAG: hypothetical protein AABY15_01795 [Nanoarchaeota archaeon]
MVVSGLPIWIVALIATIITAVYFLRYRKTWMSHWLVVLLVFAINFFFFAWGVIVFLIGEIIRGKFKKAAPSDNKE